LRILFITSNRLGDAVLTSGLLAHLVDAHSGARLTIACGPIPAPLFRSLPGLERLIPLAKRRWAGHWLDLWRQVAGTRWDLVVDLRDSAVSRLVRAGRRVTYRSAGHRLHKVAELGRLLALDPPPSPTIWTDAAAEAEATRLMPGGEWLSLAPAANWTGKEWPAERFAELADRLTGPAGPLAGARVAVLAGPGEAERCRPVLERLGPSRALDLVGRTDPLTAAACLKRARLFVGNDSGLMHLAAAAGTPTLGLFGPTPSDIYGPWGTHAALVKAADGRMGSLDLATVEAAARALLLRTSGVAA
jgi:lipopolysaccharide export system permease protein